MAGVLVLIVGSLVAFVIGAIAAAVCGAILHAIDQSHRAPWVFGAVAAVGPGWIVLAGGSSLAVVGLVFFGVIGFLAGRRFSKDMAENFPKPRLAPSISGR